jgi:hypothetical protein
MPQGSDLRRLTIIARNICGYFGFDRDPQTLKRADLRAYREHRLAQGVKNPTVRREYAFLSAAIRHEHREERLLIIPKIEMPPQVERVYAHLSPHHLLAASNMDTSILRVA